MPRRARAKRRKLAASPPSLGAKIVTEDIAVSDRANITGVAAPAAGTLEVRWVNPSNPNVEILSSKAFARSTDGGSKANCIGSTMASSATNCSLTGLRNFTEYGVSVVVCTAARDVHNEHLKGEVYPGASGGNCTATSVTWKWTIPTAPDPAKITAVAAPAVGTLEVRWANPSKANGNLSSSRAIARPTVGGSEVTCNGSTEGNTSCSLTGLRNFTEHEVLVEVCTAPAKEKVDGDVPGGGCTNSSVKNMWTNPTAPDPAKITAVAAPAAGTLEVCWANPSKANGILSSSTAMARLPSGSIEATCYETAEASSATKCWLTGLRDFTDSPPAKPEDFNFDPSKSHADIEPQYNSQIQYELASQQNGVYDREDEGDVGGPKMNVFVGMPSCIRGDSCEWKTRPAATAAVGLIYLVAPAGCWHAEWIICDPGSCRS
ncbi:hypothetical protein SprV_0802635000 [Sparganum proliferum]